MKENICGIYYIKNKENNKIYIGQSKDIVCRQRKHKEKLRINKHPNRHLQFAWNMYKEIAFEFGVLCLCDAIQLDELERKYIQQFSQINLSYNLESGGSRHKIVSDETKQKLREINTGKKYGPRKVKRVLSLETRKKMSQSLTGRKVSEETRQKISNSLLGHSFSNGTLEKMSIGHTGIPLSKESVEKREATKRINRENKKNNIPQEHKKQRRMKE